LFDVKEYPIGATADVMTIVKRIAKTTLNLPIAILFFDLFSILIPLFINLYKINNSLSIYVFCLMKRVIIIKRNKGYNREIDHKINIRYFVSNDSKTMFLSFFKTVSFST